MTHCDVPIILWVLRAHFIEDERDQFSMGSRWHGGGGRKDRISSRASFPLLRVRDSHVTCHETSIRKLQLISLWSSFTLPRPRVACIRYSNSYCLSSFLNPLSSSFVSSFSHDEMYWLQEGIQQPGISLSQEGLQSLQA